mmetsp:Transcript_7986/g.15045  ORF Transcript_7986/g.15045 Transcript_7986/m.15045 type:complete len:185 (+) Transcript_7986:116-670(+)
MKQTNTTTAAADVDDVDAPGEHDEESKEHPPPAAATSTKTTITTTSTNKSTKVKTLMIISLSLNILVLIPICGLLIANVDRIQNIYGPLTEARGILLSIYMGIAIGSAVLLLGWNHPDKRQVAFLLFLQIVYKITTPFTTPPGTGIRNPVVISNLAISVLHGITVGFIWAESGNPFRSVYHKRG